MKLLAARATPSPGSVEVIVITGADRAIVLFEDALVVNESTVVPLFVMVMVESLGSVSVD